MHGRERRIRWIEARFADVPFRKLAARVRAPHHAGKRRDRIFRKPERFADVAHGRTRAV